MIILTSVLFKKDDIDEGRTEILLYCTVSKYRSVLELLPYQYANNIQYSIFIQYFRGTVFATETVLIPVFYIFFSVQYGTVYCTENTEIPCTEIPFIRPLENYTVFIGSTMEKIEALGSPNCYPSMLSFSSLG